MEVLTALLELERLRGEEREMREQIQEKVNQLEDLLETNSSLTPEQLPRGGKTLSDDQGVETAGNLFENLQVQLFNLLESRHKFLQDVSQKINQELGVFKETVHFLERLVNFKLDQGRDKYSNQSINL